MSKITAYPSEVPSKTLYLDIEVDGITPPRDTLYEIAILDDDGNTVLDTLINTERPLGNGQRFRGLSEENFINKPTLRELWPTIDAIVTGHHVVIFNADHDCKFFPKRLAAAGHISCSMKRFAPIYGEYSAYHGSYTFKSLKEAARYIGYEYEGPPHHALTDALTCRALGRWMEDRDDFNAAPVPKMLSG